MVVKKVILELQDKLNRYQKENHIDLLVICWIFWAVFLGTLLGNVIA
jgi:hypothetical protein